MTDGLTVIPAHEASWEDLEAIFGKRGASAICWCQRYKLRPREAFSKFPAEERALRLRTQTNAGQPEQDETSGLVAYLHGEPVGWCAVEPRPAFIALVRVYRVPWEGRTEDRADDGVWAITCVLIRAGYRRRGISYALARAAVDFARLRGARALEAYPMITEPGKEVIWNEIHVGARSIFAAAGLMEVSHPTLRRAVMRIDFPPYPMAGRTQRRSNMTQQQERTSEPIILVPGFWLAAWAWDEVAGILRADGHDVTALTLPGLESADADRSGISMSDHVQAIVEAVEAAGSPVVLAVHSATGFSGYAASDRVPDRLAAMVYVDSAPGKGALDPDLEGDKPMVWDEVAEEENLDGLTEEQKETFRQRAVPVPGGVLREGVELTNDARLDIPTTIICTGYTCEQYQTYAREHPEWAFLAGVPELRNISWVDLPTSHWPMWSRPRELAEIIGKVAGAAAPRQ